MCDGDIEYPFEAIRHRAKATIRGFLVLGNRRGNRCLQGHVSKGPGSEFVQDLGNGGLEYRAELIRTVVRRERVAEIKEYGELHAHCSRVLSAWHNIEAKLLGGLLNASDVVVHGPQSVFSNQLLDGS